RSAIENRERSDMLPDSFGQSGINASVSSRPGQHAEHSQEQTGPQINFASLAILQNVPADLHGQGTHGQQRRPKIRPDGVFPKSYQPRLEQVERNVPDAEGDQANNS